MRNQIEIVDESKGVKRSFAADYGWAVDLLVSSTSHVKKTMMGISVLRAGRRTRLVLHNTEELNYVVSGSGYVNDGERSTRFKQGDAILFPAKVPHRFICDSEEDVVLLYACPGTVFPNVKFV